MTTPGTVSVVIPCHNRQELLPRAIESVLAQTVPAHQIIVVDDGSTDRSVEVARRYPVVVLTGAGRGGAPAARNRGIASVTGAYYASLDSDDWWAPDHLETMLRLLERHPSAVAVGGVVRLVGGWPGGERDGTPRLPADQPVDAFDVAFLACPLPHQTLVCRMDALRAIGGYDESLPAADDFDLYLRLSRLGPFVRAPGVTAFYHAHAGQITAARPEVFRDIYRARLKAIEARRAAGEGLAVAALRQRLANLWDEDMARSWYARDFVLMRELLRSAWQYRLRPWSRRASWRALLGLAPVLFDAQGESRVPAGLRSAVRKFLVPGPRA